MANNIETRRLGTYRAGLAKIDGLVVAGLWTLVLMFSAPTGADLASTLLVAFSASAAHIAVVTRSTSRRFGGTRAYLSSQDWGGVAAAMAVAVVVGRLVRVELSLVAVGLAGLAAGFFVAVVHEFGTARGSKAPNQRAIVIGTGEEAAEWIELVKDHPEIGIDIVGCVGDQTSANRVGIADCWLGPLPELLKVMSSHEIDLPIVAVTSFRRPALQRVVDELVAANHDVAMSWGIGRNSDSRMSWRTFSHETLPVVRARKPNRNEHRTKRAIDVVLSSVLLVLAFPLIIVAAVLIKLDSPGPALFRQKRVGFRTEPFQLLKLRTMTQEAESHLAHLAEENERAGPLFKMAKDPRVTTVGKVLRALSLDELPQLWNVVRGDMSLVGPRPALLEETKHFDSELIDRVSVRPGITGLWQLEARSNKSFAAYKRLDLHYVENWSLMLDLRIMVATAQMLLIGALVSPIAKRLAKAEADVEPVQSDEHDVLMAIPAEEPPQRVAVIGAGYVGLTQALGMTDLGHHVMCADLNTERIADLNAGVPPILEAGIDELLAKSNASGRLVFTDDTVAAVAGADVVFLCVATPQGHDGAADLTFLEAAARQIGPALAPGCVVVNKSTVPVGSTDVVAAHLGRSDCHVLSNPEFLREGTAIADWLNPDRIVVGGNTGAANQVMDLYRSLPGDRIICDAPSAELIKYASNAYLATRLTFVNSMSMVCDAVGADIHQVTTAMGLDRRIGPRYLQPGPGWGGSCLPKDTHALAHQAVAAGVDFRQLEATIAANEFHLETVAEAIINAVDEQGGATAAVLGIAFKAGTADTRESPAVKIMQRLVDKGIAVRAFDPAVTESPLDDITLTDNMLDCAAGADVLVVLTEWPEFADIDYDLLEQVMASRKILDFRQVLDAAAVIEFHTGGPAIVLDDDAEADLIIELQEPAGRSLSTLTQR